MKILIVIFKYLMAIVIGYAIGLFFDVGRNQYSEIRFGTAIAGPFLVWLLKR